jgi:hypothetical protein
MLTLVKRCIIISLSLVTCAVLTMLVVVAARDQEPSYQGKRLSEWVRGAGPTRGTGIFSFYPNAGEAEAIKAIGTNALPYLLNWIGGQPPTQRSRLLGHLRKLPLLSSVVPKEERTVSASDAAAGFCALGPQARGAIPKLTRILDNSNYNYPGVAASALGGIGKDAIPALLELVTNRPAHKSIPIPALESAWFALGTNGCLTEPVLLSHLTDNVKPGVPVTCASLLRMLGRMKIETKAAVPALCAAIESSNRVVRIVALNALPDFGDRARPAVPLLLKALTDPASDIRRNATNVLTRIDPEALRKAQGP